MKKFKLLIGVLLTAALVFSAGLGTLVGCADGGIDGKFYTLQEAYANNWLTKDDIMEVCYYRFGEVWLGENLNSDSWVKYEYEPQNTLQELDKSVENNIKNAYYSTHKSDFLDKEGNSLGGIGNLTVQYFGTYNDFCVIIMECSLWDVGLVATPMLLAGVAWWETGEGFLVYCVN